MNKNNLRTTLVIISLVIIGIGIVYFVSQFLPKKEQKLPSVPLILPKPQIVTSTPTLQVTSTPISIEPYSLLTKKDLEKAEFIWKDEKTAGITFSKLPLGAKIYMPFDGYASPELNIAFKADQITINDKDRKIEITLVGFFTPADKIKTGGTIIKKGTSIAVLDKKPPENNIWKIYEPFLIIYSRSNDKPDYSLLKNLFPDYVK